MVLYGRTLVLVSCEVVVQNDDSLTLTFLSLHFVQESSWRELTRLLKLSGAGDGADWGAEGP